VRISLSLSSASNTTALFLLAMEDTHNAILCLDNDSDASQSGSFFAVYDGHGGMLPLRLSSSIHPSKGSQTSKFASEHLYKRLTSQEPYHKKEYNAALKAAFLDTGTFSKKMFYLIHFLDLIFYKTFFL
jgi:serine/threonine protein phosphatase PrpC